MEELQKRSRRGPEFHRAERDEIFLLQDNILLAKGRRAKSGRQSLRGQAMGKGELDPTRQEQEQGRLEHPKDSIPVGK